MEVTSGSTVMSHDPPKRDGQSSDQATGVVPGRRRPPARAGQVGFKAFQEATHIKSHDPDEATSTNPASQSQTSCPKTHSEYQ